MHRSQSLVKATNTKEPVRKAGETDKDWLQREGAWKRKQKREEAKSDYLQQNARFMIKEVDNLDLPSSSKGKTQKLKIEVKSHRAILPGAKDSLRMPLTKEGELDPNPSLGSIFHPSLATWNQVALKSTPQDYFLAAFSALGHFWTLSSMSNSVGLGNVAPTVAGVLALTDKWRMDAVIHVEGDYYAAAWVIAACLDLPPGTYPVLSFPGRKDQVSMFRQEHADYKNADLYRLLRSISEVVSPVHAPVILRQMKSIPVKIWKEDKTEKSLSVLQVLLSNLQRGLAWCVGLGPGATARPEGWYSKEKDTIRLIAQHLGDPMELAIATKMSQIFRKLLPEFQSNHDKARNFAIAIHLQSANNPGSLLKAINAILKKGKYKTCFNKKELEGILLRANTDFVAIKNLLILACAVDFYTPPEPESQPAPAPAAQTASSTEKGETPPAASASPPEEDLSSLR
jgi:hypothetical protein